LSQRQYIEVAGARYYTWSEPRTEYACDVCGREVRPDEAQVHLYVRNGMHRKADGSVVQLEWFGLELHEDCIGVAGVQMYEKIVGTKKPPQGTLLRNVEECSKYRAVLRFPERQGRAPPTTS
jgi:hypothetical protein